MPAVPIIALVVAAAGAVYGGIQQKQAAQYNADVAEQGAQAAQQKAAYDETQHRIRVRKILSTERALYGESGVDMVGSPLLVQENTVKQGELDSLAIRYGGDVEAARQRSQANLYRMQGNNAQVSSYFGAGSSLLTGAGRLYGPSSRLNGSGGQQWTSA